MCIYIRLNLQLIVTHFKGMLDLNNSTLHGFNECLVESNPYLVPLINQSYASKYLLYSIPTP